MNVSKAVLLSIALLSGFFIAADSDARQQHELEIVDQDGQKVDVNKLKLKQKNNPIEAGVQAGNGKIVVVDKNGAVREIDVSGAQSIVVNKSVSSIMRDGEEEQKITGKAIIIGPDGQRQEIDLGGLGEGEIAKLSIGPFNQERFWERLPGNLNIQRFGGGSKYAIGVHCKPISDALRAHIDIEEGAGLVVTNEPVAGSPAATAGILQHDILIYADQNQLTKTNNLTEAIQAAAEENLPLSITLLRKGKEIGVELTPVKRQTLGPAMGGIIKPGFKMQMQELGPGFIVDEEHDAMVKGLMKRMEAMDAQFQRRMDDFMLLRDELNHALRNEDDK